MASAAIRIDQLDHSTTPYGVIGRARDDLELDLAVTMRNGDNSGVTGWRWALLSRPRDSTAVLSNPTAPTVTFTPDVEGSYRVRLTVNGGLVGEVATTVAVMRDANGLRIPATEESTEANWLVDGVPNAGGWWPDVEALLIYLRDGLAEAAALEPRVDALEDADVALAASIASEAATRAAAVSSEATTRAAADTALSTRVTALESDATAVAASVVYDLDFTAQANNTLVDGNESIDGHTWVAANIAARTTLADIALGTGLRMTHLNGVSSQIAGTDNAPRISIALSSIISSYNPRLRYYFFVAYSWAVTPDSAGERFSFGIHGASAAPNPSAGLRFAGATAHYNSTAGAVVHEGERTQTISNSQTPQTAYLGFSLDSPIGFTIWQASSLPDATLSNITPVIYQQADNITNGGNYELFNFAAGRLTLALAATGTAAVHSVVVTRLRIIRGRG